jgi:O-antigen/teichoic acid export membrane protein
MARKSGVYGIAQLIRSVSGLALLPIFTRYMTPTDYGIMDLLDVALTIATLLFGVRLADAMLYYYFEAATEERRQVVVTTAFLASALSGAAMGCLGWVASPEISRILLGDVQYTWYVRLMFLSLSVTFTCEAGTAYLRALNYSALFALLTTARLLATIALILVLMVGFNSTVAAFFWASIVTGAALSVYLYASTLRGLPLRLDVSLLWRMIKYGFPLACQGLAILVINIGDRVFLRRVVSLGEIGTYALAYKFGMLVDSIRVSFDTYWRAQSFALLKRGDGKAVYSETCTYLLLVLGTAAVGIVVFLRPALRVFVGPKFTGVDLYVPWITLAYVICGMAGYFRTVMRTENQTHWEGTVAAVATTVCLVGYFTLIPAFHVWGAIAATGLAFVAMLVTSYWLGQRVKHHEFEWGRMAKIFVAGIVVTVAAQILPPAGFWLELGISAGLMTAYFLILVGAGFLNAHEKRLIRQGAGVMLRRMEAYWVA